MWEMQVWSLGQEDALEKEMATYSSIFAWKFPSTEGPVGLQSIASLRLRHDLVTELSCLSFEGQCHRFQASECKPKGKLWLWWACQEAPGLRTSDTSNVCFLSDELISKFWHAVSRGNKPLQPMIMNARVPWEVIPLLSSTGRKTCVLCNQRNKENHSIVPGGIPVYLSLIRSKAI